MNRRDQSPFELALEAMSPAERIRAQRLRDVLRIREDDALWAFCSIGRTFGGAGAAEPGIPGELAEVEPHGAAPLPPANAPRSSGAAEGEIFFVTIACTYVALAVLVGSACFTLAAVLTSGHAWWLPTEATSRGALGYAIAAILEAPVGGFLCLGALAAVGACAVVAARVRRLRA